MLEIKVSDIWGFISLNGRDMKVHADLYKRNEKGYTNADREKLGSQLVWKGFEPAAGVLPVVFKLTAAQRKLAVEEIKARLKEMESSTDIRGDKLVFTRISEEGEVTKEKAEARKAAAITQFRALRFNSKGKPIPPTYGYVAGHRRDGIYPWINAARV